MTDLTYVDADWSTGVCRSDRVSVNLPAYIGNNFHQYAVPRKFTLVLSEPSGLVRAAGVLGIPEGTENDKGLPLVALTGTGVETLYSSRYVLPYPYTPLIDPAGYPITARDTRITGVQYGTMMKRLYQQAMLHPGGSVPTSWEADRAGTREKGWEAVSGKPVQDAVEDISALEDGVEWDWVPHLDSNDNLFWSLVTGLDSAPEISQDFTHTWTTGGKAPAIRKLTWKISPEFMCSTAIFMGGKDDDRVLAAVSHNPSLIDNGMPLIEIWDSSHSSVSEQPTLNGWANKTLSEGQAPVQYWDFEVRADRSQTVRHGDWCVIDIKDHETIPDGSYSRRIVEISGKAFDDYISVTVAGELSW